MRTWLIFACLFAGAAFGQTPGACDRACLEGFVNQYLDAMVAHDASRIPVAPDVRFSEDDVPLKLGEAFWKTASGIGTYKLYFADPQAGQVGFMGTMKENGRGVALVMRLKIENGRISEAEQLVLRSEATAASLEKAKSPDPILTETVPAAGRLPRTQLIANTNLYFEAIEQGNGGVAPFHPDCNRFENGTKTSGPLGCSAQLDTHVFDYIRKIYPRRFLVVDEERQNVFGFFMFNHPGDVTCVDGGELFHIQDKQIRKVEALMVALPYGQKNPFVPQQ